MQHDLGDAVVSTLHVHLDHDRCLEVIVMRGPARELQVACDRIIATKGVEHGRAVMTALPSPAHTDHGHGHGHGTAAHAAESHVHSHATKPVKRPRG